MKINSNITAYLTNNAYLKNEKLYSASTKRLSSGYKLNKAGDDPANFAISSKMRSQLESLDKVKTNATTGTSVLESAESAMSEIQDMVTRMSELATKAANGTMSSSDRQAIQDEVDELEAEITRIGTSTEFNGQPLLDGNFEYNGYCNNTDSVKVNGYSDETEAGTYTMALTYTMSYDLDTYSLSGSVESIYKTLYPSVSEVTKTTLAGDTEPTYSVTVSSTDSNGNDISNTYSFKESKLEDGKYTAADGLVLQPEKVYSYTVENGTDETASGVKTAEDLFGKLDASAAQYTTKTKTVDGTDYVTVSSKNGSEVTLAISDRDAVANSSLSVAERSLEINLTGEGAMRLQVGVNQGDVMELSIPEMSLSKMNIDTLDMTSEKSATKAIDMLDDALSYVNSARSKIGAYENRLDSTINYVDATNESLSASYSRIRDTDMAEEMTEYTNLQVLTQAGTSMLAQANQFPQQALQLLQ